MGKSTHIQWTQHTWNPWRGCAKVHARCKNCYMFAEQRRYGQDPSVVVRTKTWGDPARWNMPACKRGVSEMVFTCSWSDWFHQDADAWREEAWAVVRQCPNLTFQILTKRPLRIKECLPPDWGNGYPNVWLGSSLDPQDEGGMALFGIPVRVRFLSLEPLLGSVDLSTALPNLNWCVVGGESGPNSRPCNIGWIRSVVAQCKAAGVPCFVKQLGANVMGPMQWVNSPRGAVPDSRIRLQDRKGGDMSEFPEDLRVREFPTPKLATDAVDELVLRL